MTATGNGASANGAAPKTVLQVTGAEATSLAAQAAVFDDLQYVLRCCEHLVTALAPPQPDIAFVEALWTGALVGYVRCFSGRQAVLADDDLTQLDLDVEDVEGFDASEFHSTIKKLRDHYASRHVNPRETYTVGVAQSADGTPNGVAVMSASQPMVDTPTVRLLGRIAYGLSALLDARIQKTQNDVLGTAGAMSASELAELPVVNLS